MLHRASSWRENPFSPVPLRKHLAEHEVFTAFEKEWSHLKNGELLQQAEEESFEVLVTTDQNLRYQQNLQERKIAIVVLMSTSWPKIQRNITAVVESINAMKVRDYLEVAIFDTDSDKFLNQMRGHQWNKQRSLIRCG